jgi:hypothetical protein
MSARYPSDPRRIARRRLAVIVGVVVLAAVIAVVLISRGGSSDGALERAATALAREPSSNSYAPARPVMQGMSPARGTVMLVLRQGRWQPEFSPRTVHPAFGPGDALRLTVTQPSTARWPEAWD